MKAPSSIAVHNIPVWIAWNEFKPGTSFFVPCLNFAEVRTAIKEEAQRLKVEILIKPVMHNSMIGLRVWRVVGTLPSHSPSSPQEV